ncbi:hypothetical protein [Thiorhodococcus fuscus]|uniref:Uncharacterized protein n=1 Tax=Thiorhodococcus fuscus TaxID=527200 RepID=A0ABW4Y3W7_9GAMM
MTHSTTRTFDIYPERRLVVGRFAGPIDYQDVIAWVKDAMGEETFSSDYDGVVDLRRSTLKEARPDRARFVANYTIDEGFTQGRWAILVDRPKETALSYIFSSIAAGRYPVQVFSTTDAASIYLRRDLSDLLPE